MSARRRRTKGPDRRVDHHVVIIGAGLSGIGVARDLLRAGVSDITIFERAAAVGGTWRDNVYPGIGVDVPAQAYQFRDACNPEWSRFYAKGPEVLAYVERLADDFGVRALIRFNSEVGERHWDDDADLWRMKVNGKDVTARFVVVAAGPFPEPKPAELPGLDDFTGTILKSASWDQSVDLAGKRVAIIGTGASAVQIIPEIAREVGHLDVYQRTPIWIFPKFDPTTPSAVKTFFRRVPLAQRLLQEGLEFVYAGVLVYGVMYYANIKIIPQAVSSFLRNVTYRMAVPDKQLRAKLTPDYDFGCKRPAVSSSYLQTFNRDNVDLITDPIETITRTGIRPAAVPSAISMCWCSRPASGCSMTPRSTAIPRSPGATALTWATSMRISCRRAITASPYPGCPTTSRCSGTTDGPAAPGTASWTRRARTSAA
ncbi:Probable monooxygenase [Mycobacteroides abscessus]|nr:Probable monooxygenase [Mycobacteroides abscessus]